MIMCGMSEQLTGRPAGFESDDDVDDWQFLTLFDMLDECECATQKV